MEYFFPTLQLDLKVPKKFCKQNHISKGKAALLSGLLAELSLHRSIAKTSYVSDLLSFPDIASPQHWEQMSSHPCPEEPSGREQKAAALNVHLGDQRPADKGRASRCLAQAQSPPGLGWNKNPS